MAPPNQTWNSLRRSDGGFGKVVVPDIRDYRNNWSDAPDNILHRLRHLPPHQLETSQGISSGIIPLWRLSSNSHRNTNWGRWSTWALEELPTRPPQRHLEIPDNVTIPYMPPIRNEPQLLDMLAAFIKHCGGVMASITINYLLILFSDENDAEKEPGERFF